MAAQNVCTFNKYGFCKYRERCLKVHIDDVCDDSSCDNNLNCNRRHPKECIYDKKYKRCKFDPCKYLHRENNIDEILKTKETIDLKIKLIDDKLEVINDKIVALENSYAEKHQQIKHTFENKLEIFETNLNTLKTVISEKENYIKSLEATVSRIQEDNKDQNF